MSDFAGIIRGLASRSYQHRKYLDRIRIGNIARRGIPARMQAVVTAHLVLVLLAGLSCRTGREVMGATERQVHREYYARWVGVAAPEFGPAARDRWDGPPVRLEEFRGRKVLLYSFDAGDFVVGPEPSVFPENLRKLNRALGGQEQVAVVGFTAGVMFFFPNVDVPPQVRRLTKFPIVNSRTVASSDPYPLLGKPGGIVIDRNGVIQAVFAAAMSEHEIRRALATPDWDGPLRPTPVDDRWEGKGPPIPKRTVAVKWSKALDGIVGLTRGDWDGDGTVDIVLLQADDRLTVLDASGHEKLTVAMPALRKGPLSIKLRSDANGVRILKCRSGWPRSVPVYDAAGKQIWRYPPTDEGVDDAGWVDIDGDGASEMLIGLNGFAGFHLVSHDGQKLWANTDVKNRWCVAGFDARDGRPGLALCSGTDGVIRTYDAHGREVGRIALEGERIIRFATAEMSDAGNRQVLFFTEPSVGKFEHAVAADLNGNVLWRYPVTAIRHSRLRVTVVAADVTGDGTKEWVVQSSPEEVVAIDMKGVLVAKYPTPSVGLVLMTATGPTDGGAELLVLGDDSRLVAYALNDPGNSDTSSDPGD